MISTVGAAIALKNMHWTHAVVDSSSKKTMTNASAIACIFALTGENELSSSSLRRALNAWRFEEIVREKLMQRSNYQRFVFKRSFNYLFNTSTCGGYGFVGADKFVSCNPRTYFNERSNSFGKFDRPTYYYRARRGMYALTIRGATHARDLLELGAT